MKIIRKIIQYLKNLFSSKKKSNITFEHFDNRSDWTITEHEIAQLINVHRKSMKLEPLKTDKFVKELADIRTSYCIKVGKATHDQYGSIVYLAQGKGLQTATEIVAGNYYNALSVVRAWTKSESHNDAMLNKTWTYMGVSCKEDSTGARYFCTVFVK